jgi:hypothetical protein
MVAMKITFVDFLKQNSIAKRNSWPRSSQDESSVHAYYTNRGYGSRF